MTDTPETDANDEAWAYNEQYNTFNALIGNPLPWDEFSRKLERERDKANALARLNERLADISEKNMLEAEEQNLELIYKRDEAREHIANLEISLTAAIRSANARQKETEEALSDLAFRLEQNTVQQGQLSDLRKQLAELTKQNNELRTLKPE